MRDSERKKILVVDDSEFMRTFTCDTLQAAGYDVEAASDVWIAPIINRFRPDLILMDVVLNTYRGNVLTEVLRKYTFGRQPKILLYSIKPEPELRALAAECGADGYIPKSDDPQQLVKMVAAALEAPRQAPAAMSLGA